MRLITTGKLAKRISALGYQFTSNAVDAFGQHWEYRVSPNGPGTTSYFADINRVEKWTTDVEQIRSWR